MKGGGGGKSRKKNHKKNRNNGMDKMFNMGSLEKEMFGGK